MSFPRRLAAALPLALAAAAPSAQLSAQQSAQQPSATLDSATVAAFRWRPVGPANMSGRITDVEVDPRNTKVFYVAAGAGGIWKTINNGVTFFPVFDRERVISMGDIAVAPSNPDIIYAGTGEEDSRNSISPGGGIYKSTDGGMTWKLTGLEATQTVGRIVVHPTDPNVVYVAALGAIWNTNRERGLYKTTDGGQSWQNVKFISDRAGFVDVVMHPNDPNTLWAASWERIRTPYSLKSGGPGSGLWKTIDAGKTWSEVKGGGWPTTTKGRIGLALSPSNPQIMYAWAEADTNPNPLKKGEKPDTTKRQKLNSGIYRTADGGATWALMQRNEGDARPFYYSQVRVDPKNPDRIYWMSSVFRFSDDGGKTARRGALSIHTDWHAMWIDPNDPDHFIIADDGGVAVTYDKGGTYDFLNTMALGQFYAVSYDMQKPYRVCGGLQDNGSWCGPSRTASRFGIMNEDWFNVGGGDGFYTAQDPTDPNVIYSESQGGRISRLDVGSGRRVSIRGGGFGRGRGMFEDSLIVARGDTAQPETPAVTRELARLREKARLDSTSQMRFNWNTPYFLSGHAPTTVYAGGNRVIKSTDRGDHFFPISPDLSIRDTAKIRVSTSETGGVTADNTGAETFGTITTLAESPIRPGILWAGTDDGNVWVTHNDGGAWEDVTARFPGVPKGTYVTRVTPSAFDTAAVYVTFDGHRTGDFKPYVYASTDFGKTFRAIANNLPTGGPDFVHVITEDPANRDLLFLGTDVGAYVSVTRGASWQKFMTGLPTVPVHDLKVHPRDRELIAATHGRSIWIVDVAALEQMTDSVLRKPAHLFASRPAYQYSQTFQQAWNGNKVFQVDNPPFGGAITYRVAGTPTAEPRANADGSAQGSDGDAPSPGGESGEASAGRRGPAGRGAARDTARIVITNVAGDTVRVLTGPAGPGVHRVTWDLRGRAAPLGPAALRDSIAGARARRMRQDSVARARKDSIAKSGGDTSEAGMRAAMRAGAAGRDSSGGPTLGTRGARQSSAPGMWGDLYLRPAEERPRRPGQGAEEGGEGGEGRGGGRFGGGRQGPLVKPGDYLVTVTVAGQTLRQVITVERTTEVNEEGGGEADWEEEEHDR
ncbi:MAG TPA: hypothetical protein VKA84_21240 [Gemmatimonadaceae bacterium]|nr:hypothetical protein [Gemmatimonadaceae bacterium]